MARRNLAVTVTLESEALFNGSWLIIETLSFGRNPPIKKYYYQHEGNDLLTQLDSLRNQFPGVRVINHIGYFNHANGHTFPDLKHIHDTINSIFPQRPRRLSK